MSRTYSKKFKEDAVKYAETHKDNLDYHQMADNLGIPYGTLYGWVKEDRRQKNQEQIELNETPENLEAAQREIAFLKRELRDTQDALTVLKKAISILND